MSAHQQIFISEIEAGLLSKIAAISPKFLYSPLGSHLFTAITYLPEYYPTQIEKNIFAQYKVDIAKTIGAGGTLIDLGAGNCQKAERLFGSLKPSSYVAIDFSLDYLQEALQNLQGRYPQISMQALGMDFSSRLAIPSTVPTDNRIFFYPGSSIGNFPTSEAKLLLRSIKHQMNNGELLIGVDLIKEDAVLKAAYDDPLKITAAFNLNILRTVNSYLSSNFKVDQFRHLVKINATENRVELYLEALEDLTISWPGKDRSFKKGELIHTENSHKYSVESIKLLLQSAGFQVAKIWTDPKDYFAIIYAQ